MVSVSPPAEGSRGSSVAGLTPGPHWGMGGRQPADVSLSHPRFSLSEKKKSNRKKYPQLGIEKKKTPQKTSSSSLGAFVSLLLSSVQRGCVSLTRHPDSRPGKPVLAVNSRRPAVGSAQGRGSPSGFPRLHRYAGSRRLHGSRRAPNDAPSTPTLPLPAGRPPFATENRAQGKVLDDPPEQGIRWKQKRPGGGPKETPEGPR